MSSTDQHDPTICPHCQEKHSINIQELCGSMRVKGADEVKVHEGFGGWLQWEVTDEGVRQRGSIHPAALSAIQEHLRGPELEGDLDALSSEQIRSICHITLHQYLVGIHNQIELGFNVWWGNVAGVYEDIVRRELSGADDG